MEGSGGNFKSPAHNLHHLPQLNPRILGRVTAQVPPFEAKLLQQLAALREEVLYRILLDLHKAYDALDRSR